jgi:hypothetical protein
MSKKFKVFIDSFISFSYAPIRFMSLAGAAIGLLGFLYSLIVIFNAFRGIPVEGWASLMVVVLMLGGFQLLMLGVLGEYLWRAFDEARGRPRYVIEELRRSPDKGQPMPLNGGARSTRSALMPPPGTKSDAVRRETAAVVQTEPVGESA